MTQAPTKPGMKVPWIVDLPSGDSTQYNRSSFTRACRGDAICGAMLNFATARGSYVVKHAQLDLEQLPYVTIYNLTLDDFLGSDCLNGSVSKKTAIGKLNKLRTWGLFDHKGYHHRGDLYFHEVRKVLAMPPAPEKGKLRGIHARREDSRDGKSTIPADLPTEFRSILVDMENRFNSELAAVVADMQTNFASELAAAMATRNIELQKRDAQIANLQSQVDDLRDLQAYLKDDLFSSLGAEVAVTDCKIVNLQSQMVNLQSTMANLPSSIVNLQSSHPSEQAPEAVSGAIFNPLESRESLKITEIQCNSAAPANADRVGTHTVFPGNNDISYSHSHVQTRMEDSPSPSPDVQSEPLKRFFSDDFLRDLDQSFDGVFDAWLYEERRLWKARQAQQETKPQGKTTKRNNRRKKEPEVEQVGLPLSIDIRPLEMPDENEPWNVETAVFIQEVLRKKRYSATQRPKEIEKTKRMFQEYSEVTRETFIRIWFMVFNDWWISKNGLGTMTDLMADPERAGRPRIQRKLEALANQVEPQSPRPTETKTDVAPAPTITISNRMRDRIQAALEQKVQKGLPFDESDKINAAMINFPLEGIAISQAV